MSFDPSGQFRRSGQRDDRRRRLLVEEGLAGDDPQATPSAANDRGPAVRRSRHYGDAEFLGHARRVFDLVPRGWGTWFLLAALGTAVIVLIELAYAKLPPELVQATATFDLLAPGSLARWAGSLILLTGAAVSVLIYAVRRHRTDDYRGRYRRWLIAAVACVALAADEAAGVFPTLLTAAEFILGSDWLRTHWSALVGGLALLGLLLCFRPLWDLRECPLALALAVASALALTAAVVFRAMPWEWGAVEQHAMACKGADLTGYTLALLALGLFARSCLLDAEGRCHAAEERLPPRVDKPGPWADNQPRNIVRVDRPVGGRDGDKSGTDSEGSTRASAPDPRSLWQRLAGKIGLRRAKRPSEPPKSGSDGPRRERESRRPGGAEPPAIGSQERLGRASPSDDGDSGEGTDGKPSKAERKALKQQLMKERIARQQQQQAKWR